MTSSCDIAAGAGVGTCQAPRRTVAAVVAASMLRAFLGPAAAAETCPPLASEMRAVASIDDVASVTLDDGSELRLMGVLAPTARDLPVVAATWPPQSNAAAELARLLQNRTITIAREGAFRDRYGRRVAHAFVRSQSTDTWLQAALVDAGHARVAPLPGEAVCVQALYAREAVARGKRAGLWASPAYDVRAARHTRTLAQLTGTFQIVEGWVTEVASRRNEVFLNFGRNWRWDFTAAVDLRRAPDRTALAARLAKLKGSLVRVRGYIERRNGPFVALASAEAIEQLPEGSSGGQ